MAYDTKKVASIQDEVVNELWDATEKFGKFASSHEGYAVIKEELDELWECVKNHKEHNSHLREEARQIAAMAMRFMLDLTEEQ